MLQEGKWGERETEPNRPDNKRLLCDPTIVDASGDSTLLFFPNRGVSACYRWKCSRLKMARISHGYVKEIPLMGYWSSRASNSLNTFSKKIDYFLLFFLVGIGV